MTLTSGTLSRNIIIANELGLHARPSAKIAELAQKARSGVWIIKNEKTVTATSVIDILSLGCSKGEEIILQVDDPADINTLDQIAELAENGFKEIT